MTTIPSPKILLVGAGNMARAYAKVLQFLKKEFLAIGRGQENCRLFEKITGHPALVGGLENWLKQATSYKIPKIAIVTTNEEQLGPATRLLIQNGVKTILLEKPGGINKADLKKTEKLALKNQAKVYIAYNRRFYASVLKAKELIKKDGGVTSFHFDFTEWSHRIKKSAFSPAIKKEWLLANSSHVLDLAFFLGGLPKKINTYTSGGLDWHPRASIYVGSGVSQKEALFSYHANWESAGRWSVEIMTTKRKLIFRPLEKLQIQKIENLSVEDCPLDDRRDRQFKPGLYLQLKSFLSTQNDLPTIEEQVKNVKYFNLINKHD